MAAVAPYFIYTIRLGSVFYFARAVSHKGLDVRAIGLYKSFGHGTVLKIFRGVMPGVFRLARMEPAKPRSRWVTERNSLQTTIAAIMK